MERLIKDSGRNSSSDYDQIFKDRQDKGVHWSDLRRWKYLLKYYKSGKIADLGCLDSKVPELIKDQYSYLGIDLAEKALNEMQSKYPQANYLVSDIYDLKSFGNQFDYVVLGEVIEHLEHPQKAISEAIRILKYGGILALSTPLNEAIEPGAVDAERHIWSYTEEDMYKLMGRYGKVKIKILRSRWFPTYKYCFPQIICWVKKDV